MQDRFVGDIGDYGKLGLLRYLLGSGLSLGVNWYRVSNADDNNDGMHIAYLRREEFSLCDRLLWQSLKEIVEADRREIASLEQNGLLNAAYFGEPLDNAVLPEPQRSAYRQAWHEKAMKALAGVDLVFLDPDTGLMVPSKKGTAAANKYVEPEEMADYYAQGSSVVYYQHKARRLDSFYMEQHKSLLESGLFPSASGLGVKFNTTSLRYYFFILRPEHEALISAQVQKMLAGPWRRHFSLIELN